MYLSSMDLKQNHTIFTSYISYNSASNKQTSRSVNIGQIFTDWLCFPEKYMNIWIKWANLIWSLGKEKFLLSPQLQPMGKFVVFGRVSTTNTFIHSEFKLCYETAYPSNNSNTLTHQLHRGHQKVSMRNLPWRFKKLPIRDEMCLNRLDTQQCKKIPETYILGWRSLWRNKKKV